MSKKYTLTLSSGDSKEYARKDAAVSAGDKAGERYTVASPSGAIVHEGGAEPGELVLQYRHGAKVFFRAMAAGAAHIAESEDLNLDISMKDLTVTLSGGTKRARGQAADTIEDVWGKAYARFKEWKKENRDERRGFRDTSEGRHNMLVREWDLIEGFCKAEAGL